ncbi:unnamed protein product [Meganyctiphanes norvegica]|uniref:Uncharacterized protein n=1 Tax=Meganyctiphanes norvegica TaxID=48144 RepID=A0AAV2RN16_MEGNR
MTAHVILDSLNIDASSTIFNRSSSVPNALPSTARPSTTPSSLPIVLPTQVNITEPTAPVVSALDIEAFIHQMHPSTSDQLLVPSVDPLATSNSHSTTTSLHKHAFTPVSQRTRSRSRPYPTSGSQVSASHSSPSILQSQARALPGIPSHVLAASQVTPLPSPISGRTRLRASHSKPPILSPTILPTTSTGAIPKRHKRFRQQDTPYSRTPLNQFF